MELNLVELAAQYGVTGSLLLICFWWLARHYLPEHQRQHREELERILNSHDHTVERLAQAVDRNTRIAQYNSQVLLVQSFVNNGLSRAEAEEIAGRIELTVLDSGGLGKPQPSP